MYHVYTCVLDVCVRVRAVRQPCDARAPAVPSGPVPQHATSGTENRLGVAPVARPSRLSTAPMSHDSSFRSWVPFALLSVTFMEVMSDRNSYVISWGDN